MGMYVSEMSLTSTSSKDHLLKSLIEPSPTTSGGRIAFCVTTGASPAIPHVREGLEERPRRDGTGYYRRTWLQKASLKRVSICCSLSEALVAILKQSHTRPSRRGKLGHKPLG